jgi:hypothetical protein
LNSSDTYRHEHILPCTSLPTNPVAPLASYLFYQGYPEKSKELIPATTKKKYKSSALLQTPQLEFYQHNLTNPLFDANSNLASALVLPSALVMPLPSSNSIPEFGYPEGPQQRSLHVPLQQRNLFMSMFLSDDTNHVHQILRDAHITLSELNVNQEIDDQGHTPLHWAAALGRISILNLLLSLGGDVFRKNCSGETPLMLVVMNSNAFDQKVFPRLLSKLALSIPMKDKQGRTALHRIVQKSIDGSDPSAKYYLQCFIEYIQHYYPQTGSNLEGAYLLEIPDSKGETALSMASKAGAHDILSNLFQISRRSNETRRALYSRSKSTSYRCQPILTEALGIGLSEMALRGGSNAGGGAETMEQSDINSTSTCGENRVGA